MSIAVKDNITLNKQTIGHGSYLGGLSSKNIFPCRFFFFEVCIKIF